MRRKFPNFKTDAEAEEFVATADLSEYDVSDMTPMRFELRKKDTAVSLRLPEKLYEAVRARAERAGIPYQQFIRWRSSRLCSVGRTGGGKRTVAFVALRRVSGRVCNQIRLAPRGALSGPPSPAVERPGAGAVNRQREKAPGHGDVLPHFDRLIRAEVEEERRQQAKAEERDRRPARLQADEHKQAAAELGQNDERQKPPVDAVGLHVADDARVVRDFLDPLDDENVSEHCAANEAERARPA